MAQGPIFIGGAARSGKTLMRFLLSSHPHLAFSRRTKLWTHFDGRFGDLGQDENLDRCLAVILATKHVRLLQPDPARIRAEFVAGSRSYARLFTILHEQYAAQQGKPRWGDQSALIELHAARVLTALPGAVMIHLLRDPRDCYQAMTVRPSGMQPHAGDLIAWWRRSAGAAAHNLTRYPGRYLVIQYEALVRAPEETMVQVCDFLDEPYVPAMLHLADVPRFAGWAARGGRTPITDAYVGRYRTDLTGETIALLQRLTGPALAEHGYQPAPVALSPRRRLRLYSTRLPWQLGRMVATPALHRLRRTFSTRRVRSRNEPRPTPDAERRMDRAVRP